MIPHSCFELARRDKLHGFEKNTYSNWHCASLHVPTFGTPLQPLPAKMPPKAFPGDLSWNMASLVSLWVVGPLYGINICVYILCIHVLYMKGLRGLNLMMLIVTSVQFALATGHVIAVLVQLIRAFIGAAGTLDGPSNYLLNQSTPAHVAEVLYITNSLIGDAIMIWRLWIIWNRNIWLCVPFIVLCVASGVAGYTALVNLARLTPADTVFLSRVHSWLIATWALSIATQLGATLLISYRIWKSIQWNSSKGLRASRLSVLWILVESGALYSVTTTFLLGFSSTNTGAIFVASLGQISALAPTLIIVRAGLKSSGTSSSFTPAKGSINKPYYGPPPPQSFRRDVESGPPEDDPMVVHVKQATEIRLDSMKLHDIGDLSTVEERSSSATPNRALRLSFDT
ncbi:hypothetical protein EDB92DRAFT_1128834 [Lactarius akahatsu]|uniref:Uncharacterized protein n=1 Tax=Lactarius akahatsu TaxID=416441 RepID=A0AAD4LB98_9AGAM|nr:hypothetical protein EDB92DRAFT_1128834 [Lactarius akahatsu]